MGAVAVTDIGMWIFVRITLVELKPIKHTHTRLVLDLFGPTPNKRRDL